MFSAKLHSEAQNSDLLKPITGQCLAASTRVPAAGDGSHRGTDSFSSLSPKNNLTFVFKGEINLVPGPSPLSCGEASHLSGVISFLATADIVLGILDE